MVLEVSLHSDVSPISSIDRPAGIARRTEHLDHEGLALWEIAVTLNIRAPELWWKQAQRYFYDIVWLRARPELADDQRRLIANDFEEPIPAAFIDRLNTLLDAGNRQTVRAQLPDSFLRTGLAHTTVDTIAKIITERGHYDAGHWYEFCRQIYEIAPIAEVLRALPERQIRRDAER